MRRIEIKTWKSRISEDKEIDENLLIALNLLLGNKKPEEMPRGIDKHRMFNRLSKAFEKAEKKGVLELEEADYTFLKLMVEKDIPAIWGMNQDLSEAVENFLDAKSE